MTDTKIDLPADGALGAVNEWALDPYALILVVVFRLSLGWLEDLKATPTPMPFGASQRWASLLISPAAADKLYGESNPYAWGYAAVMEEMRAVYEAAPKLEFVPKKGKRP